MSGMSGSMLPVCHMEIFLICELKCGGSDSDCLSAGSDPTAQRGTGTVTMEIKQSLEERKKNRVTVVTSSRRLGNSVRSRNLFEHESYFLSQIKGSRIRPPPR